MGSYKLAFKESVAKDLRAIPNKDIQRILERLTQLTENPRGPGSEKISDRERYRIRQGDYRILYEIADDVLIVTVVKIGHRRDIYRNR
ncbi:MAG TPA: type II toxin-antitoxin system RelE/ParE family toxin [bacterium]|nr:type II toxin-antitoxin system RelE/ParE family toxin [bacterium]HPO08863.1 type II toxin-antitoxin system RelE/ParE family toxin [bacterium]HQO36082.1 type II toxin-antitoxin system RelE/ParE family toxin [bacterium]HQQ01199.1 type II toxin-antitoxin system RelE/ParE family toxin [bacterium]